MAYSLNPLLKLMFQKKTDGGGDIPGVEVTAEEINTLDGIDTNTTVQEQINQLHNYADISVKNWSEFLAAVQSSQTVPCRIHFTANITVESSATLNLSNCVVYGHYNRWIVNGHMVTLIGNYAYFYDVLFQGANNGATSTIAFSFVGKVSTTCNFSFENCRFYNFLETANNNIFIRVDGASGSSVHTFFVRCTINGESTSTSGRALAIRKYSGAAVSLKVTDLLFANKSIETRNVSMVGASGSYDMFVGDGSCVFIGTHPTYFWQWGLSATASSPIHYVNGSSILNNAFGNIDTTGWNVNDIVIVGNMTASTYYYVTSGNVLKTFTGSPDYDLAFRYCGNSKYNSLNVSLIA